MTKDPLMSLWTLALYLLPCIAYAGEWHVDKTATNNRVEFTSEVVALTFGGMTDKIDGYLYWEGEELFEKRSQFLFEVELASLYTGIGKRDRDMREVLDTKTWPKAVFKGKITSALQDSVAQHYTAIAGGIFTIHGVSKKMDVPVRVVLGKDQSTIAADFVVRLEDHHIEAPSLIAFVKVSEEVAVSVLFEMKHIKKGGNEK